MQNERISAYRIGGDEFCVILEKTNAVEIHQILDSLERKINVYNEKNNIKISYAKGYEISTREHYYLMEELTKRADSRMYENKRLMKGKRLDGRRLNVWNAGRHYRMCFLIQYIMSESVLGYTGLII